MRVFGTRKSDLVVERMTVEPDESVMSLSLVLCLAVYETVTDFQCRWLSLGGLESAQHPPLRRGLSRALSSLAL